MKTRRITRRPLVPVVAMIFGAEREVLGKVSTRLEAGDGGYLYETAPVRIRIAHSGAVERIAGYLPQFDVETTFPLSDRPVWVKKGDTVTLQLSSPAMILRIDRADP